MPIDYTKLLEKIRTPKVDGEDELRLRVALVAAVNANGTVDLTLSGVTVPGVPVLDGVAPAVGATVQVLSWLGALLVLGGSAAGSASNVESYKAANVQTTSTSYTPFTGTDIHGVAFLAPASGRVKLTLMGWLGMNNGSVAARCWLGGQVREGSVVNSGTIVQAVDDARAAVSQNAITSGFDYRYVNISYACSGLTPGAAYNVTGLVRVSAGNSGTQERRIMVEPF